MSVETAELLRTALSFPPEARAELAGSLLESLDTGADPEAELAWREEVPRRVDQIDSGAVTMVPWEEARKALWAKA